MKRFRVNQTNRRLLSKSDQKLHRALCPLFSFVETWTISIEPTFVRRPFKSET